MKNKYTFNYPINVVYKSIGNLVIDNAKAYTDTPYTLENLSEVDYEFEVQIKEGTLKNYSKVQEVIENQKIVYSIKREKMENYLVSFELNSIDPEKTQLTYSFDLISDKANMRLNHSIFGYLYRRQQVKKFKQMCAYLNGKCEELSHDNQI